MTAYEDRPLVQLSPADMALVHAVLIAHAAAVAKLEATYRQDASRIAAVKAPPGEVAERAAGRQRARGARIRRADLMKAEAEALARIATYFSPVGA